MQFQRNINICIISLTNKGVDTSRHKRFSFVDTIIIKIDPGSTLVRQTDLME